MNSTDDSISECRGCGSQMRDIAAQNSLDLDGRLRCVDCRLADAEDAAAEREYRAELAAGVA